MDQDLSFLDEIELSLNKAGMSFLDMKPTELNSWLDKDYLKKIADELYYLNDYVPYTHELLLPNHDIRREFVTSNVELIENETFLEKHAIEHY